MTDYDALHALVKAFSEIDWMSADGRIHQLAEQYRAIDPKVWLTLLAERRGLQERVKFTADYETLKLRARELVHQVAAQASPPTTQRELVGEVIRGVRDRLTASGEVEDYDRGVCDACNDSLELLYTGKLTPRASPTPAPQKTKP